MSATLKTGASLSLAILVVALVSSLWLPYSPVAMDIAHRLGVPSAAHWFGTDAYGRDVLAIMMAGSRTALYVAAAATILGIGLGVPLGLVAAAYRGVTDEGVMRFNDILFAFPSLLIAVLIAAIAGPGLLPTIAAIGIFNVPVFARVTRSAAIGQWQRTYVLAARTFGKRQWRISLDHILPNILGALLVQAAIQLSLAVVAEAGLSYVGLGVQPPTPSWGRMLQEAETLVYAAPWLALFPGGAILLAALAFNLLGDGLRDRFDPRGQG